MTRTPDATPGPTSPGALGAASPGALGAASPGAPGATPHAALGSASPTAPDGEPWTLPLTETPFVFLDLEMTGLDPASDRVCDLCLIRTRGRRIEHTLSTLIQPGASVGRSVEIHGIDDHALEGAPTFASVASEVTRWLDGAIVVGHGIAFDEAFLEQELARAGLRATMAGWLDTLPLARRVVHTPSHQLVKLTALLGIEHAHPHRAYDDTLAVYHLFDHLSTQLGARTARDLWHVRVGQGITRPDVIERAREAITRGRPVEVHYRPSRRSAETYRMVLTGVHDGFQPARICGYDTVSRGRLELRADRILSIDMEGEVGDGPTR